MCLYNNTAGFPVNMHSIVSGSFRQSSGHMLWQSSVMGEDGRLVRSGLFTVPLSTRQIAASLRNIVVPRLISSWAINELIYRSISYLIK